MSFRKTNPLFIMLELLIALVYFNPLADLFPSYAQIGVFVLWFLFSLKNKTLWGEAIPLSIFNIIIFIITLIRCIMANQLNMDYYSTLQVVIARYQFLIYPILFVYVGQMSNGEKKRIFSHALTCIVGTVIVSLYYIKFIDPQAIRNTQRDVALFGVGDFMLMYSMAIAAGPILFLIIERLKNNKNSKLLIVAFILMMICLILCNLVTSVVVAVCSILVMLLVRRKKRAGMVLIPFLCVIVLGFRTFFAKLLYYVAGKNLFYWSTNNKLIAIANLLSGDLTNVDTLSRRFMLASWSLESFKENVWFGINWKKHVYGKIGCHMQWADDLGRYGILGNVLLVINYIHLIRNTVGKIKESFTKDALITTWIMFFVLGFLNPCLSATNLMMIFVLIPTFDAVLDN